MSVLRDILPQADVQTVLTIAAAKDDIEVLVLVPYSNTAAPEHGAEQRGRLPAENPSLTEVPTTNQEAPQSSEGVMPLKRRRIQDVAVEDSLDAAQARSDDEAEHERREALFSAAEKEEAERLQHSYAMHFASIEPATDTDAVDRDTGMRIDAERSNQMAHILFSGKHCDSCVCKWQLLVFPICVNNFVANDLECVLL
jgi:hypothetical protein